MLLPPAAVVSMIKYKIPVRFSSDITHYSITYLLGFGDENVMKPV